MTSIGVGFSRPTGWNSIDRSSADHDVLRVGLAGDERVLVRADPQPHLVVGEVQDLSQRHTKFPQSLSAPGTSRQTLVISGHEIPSA